MCTSFDVLWSTWGRSVRRDWHSRNLTESHREMLDEFMKRVLGRKVGRVGSGKCFFDLGVKHLTSDIYIYIYIFIYLFIDLFSGIGSKENL